MKLNEAVAYLGGGGTAPGATISDRKKKQNSPSKNAPETKLSRPGRRISGNSIFRPGRRKP